MYANLGFPLTRQHVCTAPASDLRAGVKKWLERENPICLLHPLGFYVVLLCRNDTEEWRFHFWPKGPRPIRGIPACIHTHDCHVESRILQGQLTNVLYDVLPVQSGGHPLYEVSYGGDRYVSATANYLRQTDKRVEPVVRSSDTMVYGDKYHIERHAYHEALVPEQQETSTLVCMYERSQGAVMVVGKTGYPETITFRRTDHRSCAFLERLSI